MDPIYQAVRKYLDEVGREAAPANAVHQESMQKLGTWLASRAKQKSDIVIVCTGNSRRSILGSTLGNIVSAYRQWPKVRFYSAGTTPSAFNPRTIATLQKIGVVITPTGSQAKAGKSGDKNPHYRVQWGSAASAESLEYSKALGDVSLPAKDFAALMVCSEADQECPTVEGATLRLALPFEDPKTFDDTPKEAEEYAKTRDLIARTLLRIN
jgi:arsenate reductase (thioredoxin)